MQFDEDKINNKIILSFGTDEKDVRNACKGICKQIAKASNNRWRVIEKLQDFD